MKQLMSLNVDENIVRGQKIDMINVKVRCWLPARLGKPKGFSLNR